MNILELFSRLNHAIAICNEDMYNQPTKEENEYIRGIKRGIEVSLEAINNVNHGACENQQPLRTCDGFNSQKGLCKNKVPKKFLQLFCDECNRERLVSSNRPVYKNFVEGNYEVVSIPIFGDTNG